MVRAALFRFAKKKNGNALVSFSLVMPVLLGTVGMAVDVSMWVKQRDGLQAVADAAALAAARTLNGSGSSTVLQAAALQAARDSATAISASATAVPTADPATGKVSVEVTEPALISFGSVVGIRPFDLKAVAKSEVGLAKARTCILALDEDAKTGVSITGSGTFKAVGCRVHSNATSDQSIVVGGDADVTVSNMCAAGKTVINGSSATIEGTRRDGCGALDDPLASTTQPTDEKCDYKDYQIVSQGSVTLNPGTYCGGLRASAKGDITLNPGIYIIKNGPMKLTADVTVTGDNIGLFLTGSKATGEISGQADVHLSASDAGPMAGIVLASDRAQTGNNLETRISGGASLDLAGSVYLPKQSLVWRGNSRSDDPSRVTQIIAANVDIAGTADIVFETIFESENYPPIETVAWMPYLTQ
ncbi:pilus assembly protein TadG-related protein [Chthonobacter albigriseus]|uniref:pilus assembly protein TadG-related protein n=1 Tax=Chthonobacter albigriseus TaxID=1683161 RepID=UPI0015EECEAA|nr:pilus assembly protein TadG-related protein [Chthonobacter albigriseus]